MSDSGFIKWPNVRKSTLLPILIWILASHVYTTKVAAFVNENNDCATAQDTINKQQDNFCVEILRDDEESPVSIDGYGVNGLCSVPFSDLNATQSSETSDPNVTNGKCDLNVCFNFKVPITTYNLTEEISYFTLIPPPPLFPEVLQSMGKQRHKPIIVDTFKLVYDYIIVGLGTAGSVMASRLSEMPCMTVLGLEAGKPPPKGTDVPFLRIVYSDSDVNWGFNTVPQKYTAAGLINRVMPYTRGKTIGGSSVLNGMLYIRGNRKDYDNWAAHGAVGWDYKGVLPYFKKLEDNRDPEYVVNGYHNVCGPVTASSIRYIPEFKIPALEAALQEGYKIVDPNGPRQTGFYTIQATIRDGQRCSAAKAYLVPADHRANLDIAANAFVRKVIIRNGRAEGVIVDFKGKRLTVRARKEVILSAGAVNTPQILMLSGIGPKEELSKHNITVIADLSVGKNLQDHPATFLNVELDPSIPTSREKALDPRSALEYINTKSGPLSSPEGDAVEAFLNIHGPKPFVDFPHYLLYFTDNSIIFPELGINLRKDYFDQIYGPYLNSTIIVCTAITLRPKSRGKITLQSANPEDPPIIDPNYFSHPEDMDITVEGLKTCYRLCTSEPMKKIGAKLFESLIPGCEHLAHNQTAYFRCTAESLVLSDFHPVGTAKMGSPGDPTTVVDPQLRVKKIHGLRVVDASVMPFLISGNTNVPTMMIAEKASDMIKETMRCEGSTPQEHTEA